MPTATAPTTHGLTAGSILTSKWGYDQTNIDFYEVTRATAKTVWFRKIRATKRHADNWGHYMSTPVPGDYTSDERRCKIHNYGDEPFVKLTSYSYAYPWSGHSVRGTDYA